MYAAKLKEKLLEALKSVLPIIILVLLLCFSIAPVSTDVLLSFLVGAVLLIIGMMFFTLGAELAMSPIGERVGVCMTRSKKLSVMLFLGLCLGFLITIAEPDLQVLAEQVPSVPNMTLIISVALGVGLFLCVALLRMLFSIALPPLLIGFYTLVFILTFFAPEEFLAVAFDAGGVTTGPMTVPFIMALGVGISQIRTDRHAADDSFGLVALCSIGPILATLVLGILYQPEAAGDTAVVLTSAADSVELARAFVLELPTYLEEIALSFLPIVLFFLVFQVLMLHLAKKALVKIGIGLIYTYVGLVLFLTGVNVGFMPAGNYLGSVLAALPYRAVLVPIGMIIGYFIVMAEPAVYVLKAQVEELTDGAVSGAALERSLCIGVAVAVGLAMIRVLTGISIIYFVLPGYVLALCLSFFVPKIFTAIAFDSGGVASGPMTATFLLPLAKGACVALGGNVVQDAFGVVAMVAMTPLITIQLLGLYSEFAHKKGAKAESELAAAAEALLAEEEIILL